MLLPARCPPPRRSSAPRALEERSEQRTGEDVVSLKSLDSPQRERLNRLAADFPGSSRLHVTFADDEDFPAVGGLELDHGVQR